MGKRIDLTNKVIGQWTVLYPTGSGYWHCKCSCGTERDVLGTSLRSGKSLSCGCLRAGTQGEDLTGKQFGEWTVGKYTESGKYECKCSCGTVREVSAYSLVAGESTSCGHNTTGFKNLAGKHFGEWEVLKYAGNRHWECKCSCGVIKNVAASSLTSGRSTNCGCANRIDLTGKQFGELTVLSRSTIDNNLWFCLCSCGNKIEVRGRALITGNTKSCGCKTIELKRQTMLNRYGDIAVSRIGNPRSQISIEASTNSDKLKELIIQGEQEKKSALTLKDVAGILDITKPKASIHIKEANIQDRIKYGVYGDKEDAIVEYIESFGYKVERHNRELIKPYEIDIYIPEKRIAIEFNGTYWHDEKSKGKIYHQQKTLMCIRNKIRLIHIFEYEWETKNDLIKEFLYNIFNKEPIRIYARNTDVKEVSSGSTSQFIRNNHLQGSTNAPINIALIYNNEIVSAMTFGKPRFSNGYEYELLRLAHKSGTQIIGGSEKMFKYFIRKYKPTSIISYCDAAKFIGNVYFRLGFKLDKEQYISQPNYVWVDKHNERVYSRYRTQKHKLIAAGLGSEDDTEVEIMENLGYTRVFDSGNYRFIWHKYNT